jgi:hypothetical protein
MSHSIIINGRRVPSPHGKSLVAQHAGDEGAEIEYTITYRPSHDLPLQEQIKRTGKIQKLAAKIEGVAVGGEE